MRPRLESAVTGGTPDRRWTWLRTAAPWLVGGVAAAFRFSCLDLAAFTFDDADAIRRARALANGEAALVGGLTSWGIHDPPLLVYILATVARLPSPVLASYVLMASINTLAVLGAYHLAARFFGWRYGMLAGLLYAVNPWAIYFSRRAWVEVQPALTVLALWAASEVAVAGRLRLGLAFFLALAAAVQARILALLYIPAALASIALGGRRWLSAWSVLGLLGGGLLALPYLVYVVTSHERIGAALAEGNRGIAAAPRQRALEFAWWITAGTNLLPTPAPGFGRQDLLGVTLRAESLLAAALLVAGVALCFIHCVRRQSGWERYGLLLAWTILPLALIIWQSSTVYLHYLVLLVPLVFLLVALPLDWLFNRPRFGWLGVVLFLALTLPQVTAWVALQRTLQIYGAGETIEASMRQRRALAELARESGERIRTGETYGIEVPLRFWLAAADLARAEIAVAPRELLVAAKGSKPDAEEQPAMLAAVLGTELTPRYQPDSSLVVPVSRPALLLANSDVELPLTAERLGTRRAFIPLPVMAGETRNGIRLIDLPARSASEWAATLGAVFGDPNGSVAFGADRRVRAREALAVITLWPGPVEGLRPTVMLMGPNGRRLPERDSPRRQPADVPADHLLVMRHEIPVPEQAELAAHRLVAEPGTGGSPTERIELRKVVVAAAR
jgi:hypothetical protein